MRLALLAGVIFLCRDVGVTSSEKYDSVELWCRDLPVEQVDCKVNVFIKKSTQAYIACEGEATQNCCNSSRIIMASCYPKRDVVCIGEGKTTPEVWTGMHEAFQKPQSCRYVTGYNYRTTLILSVFLGMFGIDRFYLGYYAIGLFKFCTFGFFLLGQLVDIILIVTQVVGPADGSDYMIEYYGPILHEVVMESYTFFQYGSHYYKKYPDEF